MASPITAEISLNGDHNPKGHSLLAAVIEGGINDIPVAKVEFTAKDKALDLGKLVGTPCWFSIEGESGAKQTFHGICISAEAHGELNMVGHYVLELQPWLWMLTRSRNNRIFQEKTTTDIVRDVLSEHGFSGDLQLDSTKTEVTRTYCTQYNETDYDFIKRLLEEEGIYFYFDHSESGTKMVLADEVHTHAALEVTEKLPFSGVDGTGRADRVTKWESKEKIQTGKVTLRDYDFEKPSADLTTSSVKKSGSHSHASYEVYDYPGRYKTTNEGEAKAAALVEAEAAGHKTWLGETNAVGLSPGKIFELTDHPLHEKVEDCTFMVTKITQFFGVEDSATAITDHLLKPSVQAAKAAGEHVFTHFEAILKKNWFRMPVLTFKPRIHGVQTAFVTGASGDEIMVDSYGRIKVQFHWDRHGQKDDNTTCWVRTVMPWTGKNWGMALWPRVGQEVVIQFEEGDPDRPICTGMLYNADTMPPYELPGNATRSGIKTNSSKGGGGYNELMFEDKKGDELVRFDAEKDFVQTVQNSSHTRVGYGHGNDVKAADAQDAQSMKLEVYNHLDEIVETGDHKMEISAGKQTLHVEKDKTETINGGSTLTVTDDVIETIKRGTLTRKVKQGDQNVSVELGDYSVAAKLGNITMEAAQSLTLKVGPSEIKMTPAGVTIKGMMVKVEGSAMVETKAPLTQINGSAALILKGGITMIN